MSSRMLIGLLGVGVCFVQCRDFKERPKASAGSVSDGGEGGAAPRDSSNGGATYAGRDPETAMVGAGGEASDGGRSTLAGGGSGGTPVSVGGSGDGGSLTSGGDHADSDRGGAGGEAGGGGEGAVFGGTEPNYNATCSFGYVAAPVAGGALGASLTGSGDFQLYGTDPSTSSTLVRWADANKPSGWSPWSCLELVPNVTQIAAMNLVNGSPEVVALSSNYDGEGDQLFVRRVNVYWSPWLPMSLPVPHAQVTDIAASGGGRPHVYIADRGRVFEREKVGPYSAYGPWHGLPANGAVRLAAVTSSDGSQLLAVLSESGTVELAGQAATGGEFSSWNTRFDTLPEANSAPIVDFDAIANGSGVDIYALDDTAVLWRRSAFDSESTWTQLTDEASPPPIVSIAAQTDSAKVTKVFGLDVTAGVWSWDTAGKKWSEEASH